MKPFVLCITGGSGSGKTTLAKRLRSLLGPDHCAVLSQDSYYHDQSARFKEDGGMEVNFDHPSALDFDLMCVHLTKLRQGLAVDIPQYDFVTHQRLKESVTFPPLPMIIVDGILVLTHEGVRTQLDSIVFLDVPEDIRFERRFRRDVVERGRKPEGVKKQFYNQVKPMHDQFIEPMKRFATTLLTVDFDLEDTASNLASLIKSRDSKG